MKKFLSFVFCGFFCIFNADGAVRGENTATVSRATGVSVGAKRATSTRNAVKTTVSARAQQPVSVLTTKKTPTRTATRNTATVSNPRAATTKSRQKIVSRTSTTNTASQPTETRTGTTYDRCKTAFFTCMDQFCQLKNDTFRRCSCNDRIYKFQDVSESYRQVSERLTDFNENLDVVGLTKEQALAMKTASEGEDALTEDKSASKQLLQAIMNSIKGGDTSVGGKYKDLNSITLVSDTTNAFGMDDSGQIIASFNGATLYKAVYPKCRQAVKEDCNDSSLQRAVNAYLMAIEQDCNTVEVALQNQQKTLKTTTHQSSAMLDLARVENRRAHNSDDVATCITNVEKAVTSEEVCGAKYHKCLDYGEFIDVSTGAPLTGVTDFYKLGELLTFKNTENIKDQKLSTLVNNKKFVQFFESKTKKFAQDALDNCSEKADFVWQQYLDRALLDIYYAQQSKVDDIKQSCFDIVGACYDNQQTAIENAMAKITGDTSLLLKPASIALTTTLCNDYIESCNNMFSGDIIQNYMSVRDSTDTETVCRAIAQQCFDKFGGTGYENFYNPQSGLFSRGEALDWFSLYSVQLGSQSNDSVHSTDENGDIIFISPCAQELAKTDGCKNPEIIERVFGGFDKLFDSVQDFKYSIDNSTDRLPRANGIATEIFYKINDILSTQCTGINGYFMEVQFAEQYGYDPEDICVINSNDINSNFYKAGLSNPSMLDYWYTFADRENMCPELYDTQVDTASWGACSCWENGGYRSKNGTIKTCVPLIPVVGIYSDDTVCVESMFETRDQNADHTWCQQTIFSDTGQLCPTMSISIDTQKCSVDDTSVIQVVEEQVPQHKI